VRDDPRWAILRDCMNPSHTHPKKGERKDVDNIEDYLALMPRCLVVDIEGDNTPLQDVMLGELRTAFNNGLGMESRFLAKVKASKLVKKLKRTKKAKKSKDTTAIQKDS
jgi:hypothetical protein